MISKSNRKKTTNKKCFRDRKRMSNEERTEKAVQIGKAIENAQLTEYEQQVLDGEKAAVQSVKKDVKSKRISVRMTEAQYQQISKKCKNEQGEQLLTITDFIRQSALSKKNKIIAQEHPLDRFKLAVASEIATGITEIVHFIDSELDQRAGNYEVDDCLAIIDRLESLEEVASYLLIPSSENKKKRMH